MLKAETDQSLNTISADPLTARTPLLFAALAQARHWLIGVSGGPDSMALWHLAHHHAQSQGIDITAVTIDHGLRPAAALEAQQVADFARAHSLRHAIVRWEGPKPQSRLQERARAARYDLLVDFAHKINADALLTAHHRDDQIETILFRLSRGSGPAGLAGMAPITTKRGLAHHRPLLTIGKDELISYCARHHLPTIADPSNSDPRFARTQARQLLPLFEQYGLKPDDWLRLSRRAARTEEAVAAFFAQICTNLPALKTADSLQLNLDSLQKLPSELLIRLISSEIMRISGSQTPPRLEQIEVVAHELLHAQTQSCTYTSTLANCLISLSPKNGLRIVRAPSRAHTEDKKPQ
jgi:tRNA(Ile)-lysidine synthase